MNQQEALSLYFKDCQHKTIVECGAFDGIDGSCSLDYEKNGWKAILIEASPQKYHQLYINRPNAIALNMALADRTGLISFNDVNSLSGYGCGNGSICHTNKHLEELIAHRCAFKKYYVPCLTWDSIFAILQLDIDILILDVEGAETLVLDGMNTNLPKYICVEDTITDRELLLRQLQEKKYTFLNRIDNNSYFSLNK